MLPTYIHAYLHSLELDQSVNTRLQVLEKLKKLGVTDFGYVLWNVPFKEYPRLSSLLPSMTPEAVQKAWTGWSGEALLLQSISFVRSLAANYATLSGKSLEGKRILDFGCGYGRFLRLANYYSDDVWGVDPWSESIRHCNEGGLREKILQSEYLPKTLPVPTNFDLVFAFSVFTHLSERATKVCLAALRMHTQYGAISCITIRPVEYWRMVYPDWSDERLRAIEAEHEKGFAFVPHARERVENDITYGDTSMTLEWLAANATGWQVEALDRSGDDPVQRYVYLRAV